MYDLILENALTIDPSSSTRRSAGTIAVRDGLIAEIDQGETVQANVTIDASGCFVLPGLTDYHAHVFTGGSDFSAPAELMAIPNGVTTMVDGGSTGCAGFESFYRSIICNSVLDIRAMLNICTIGQASHTYVENLDPELIDAKRIKFLCREYPNHIVALKLRQSKEIVGELGLEPLRTALALANEVGKRLVVHASDSPGEIGETLKLLRPGDVFCHVFHQRGQTIINDNGTVRPELFAARERGVLFDMAHGSGQFSAKIAQAAFSQGFYPDIISSDCSALSFCVPPAYGFSHILSELLNLGMELEQIVSACTSVPSSLIGKPSSDYFAQGRRASMAIIRIVEHPGKYVDRYGNAFSGKYLVKPEITILDGKIMFRQFDNFSIRSFG